MARFFNFYDPLEKRFVFNSFLVVVALVEILILVFTLIWQFDFKGIFAEQPGPGAPFPWKVYLLASFIAPIALLFLFGLIIQGFEVFCKEPAELPQSRWGARLWRVRYLLGLLIFMAALVFVAQGRAALGLVVELIKAMGLGGSYLLIAVLALALLYLPLRLWLRYRLQKKCMEYQYLLTLAERHGVIVVDPKTHPELAAALEAQKKLPDQSQPRLTSADSQPEEESQET
jgi:hypothetical protein